MKQFKHVLKNIIKDLKEAWLPMLVIGIYWCLTHFILHEFCPMRMITGVSCPGCGCTRAFASVMLFRFHKAWEFNPSIFLWIPFGIYAGYFRYVKETKIPKSSVLLGIICLCSIGIYIYRFPRCFPVEEPFTFNEHNLFSFIAPQYNSLVNRLLEIILRT